MPSVAQFLPDAASVSADRGLNLNVYQCSGCGLVQLDSEPVAYYRDVIRAAGLSPEMHTFRQAQFREFVSRYSLSGRKVIEIGCGRGEYLTVLRDVGVDAYGLEHLAESVAACVANGLAVTQGFIEREDQAVPGAPFNAFMILNFLEHLPEPNETLRGIWHNLVDDGLGMVEVPNFDMVFRERQFAEFMSDHLLYFGAATLTTTLETNGFEVLECSECFHGYILSALVRKRAPLNLAAFDIRQSELRDELHRFVQRFGHRRVAIWGAGHQALALMALLDLGGEIRYVVDSAPFKQGKFTPATHVPILAPETLQTDPVDAVIVIAAGYSNEVARIARSRGFEGQVVILSEDGLKSV
jgi:2-polyprenyl-3-methyl-5-hydroxy-6-metoxy-1,4-benzoquinol methylase